MAIKKPIKFSFYKSHHSFRFIHINSADKVQSTFDVFYFSSVQGIEIYMLLQELCPMHCATKECVAWK